MNSKYNNAITLAIREQYVRTSEERMKLRSRLTKVEETLENEKDTLPYKTYLTMMNEKDILYKKIHDLTVQIDTWDKAREICLDACDC